MNNAAMEFMKGLASGVSGIPMSKMEDDRTVYQAQQALAGMDPGAGLQSKEMQQLMMIDPELGAQVSGMLGHLHKERQNAFYQDSRMARHLLETGNLEGFSKLSVDRLQGIEAAGGDPSDWIELAQMVQDGDYDGALKNLRNAEALGVVEGYLQPPPGPAYIGISDQDKSKALFQGPDGQIYAQDIEGLDPNLMGMDLEKRWGVTKDFISQASTFEKPYLELQSAFSGIKSSYDSAIGGNLAGQESLIFNYLKILDPDSSVLENEKASASDVGANVPTRILNLYNRVVSGDRMSEDQINALFSDAQDQFFSKRGVYLKQREGLVRRAGDKGIMEEEIFNIIKDEWEKETMELKKNKKKKDKKSEPAKLPQFKDGPTGRGELMRNKKTGEQFYVYPDGSMEPAL